MPPINPISTSSHTANSTLSRNDTGLDRQVSALIGPDDIDRFDEDGAICIRRVADADTVARLREMIEEELARLDAAGERPLSGILAHLCERSAEARRFICESPVAEICRQMLRSERVSFYFDQAFIKEPGVSGPTPWHQDQPYWAIHGSQVCSVWLALCTVSKEATGLEYVAGSHRWGKAYSPVPFSKESAAQGRYDDAENDGERVPDIDGNRDAYRLLAWDMEPGDCLIHRGYTLHGSSFNSTRTQQRWAYSTRWFGDDATYATPRPYMDNGTFDPDLQIGDSMFNSRFARRFARRFG